MNKLASIISIVLFSFFKRCVLFRSNVFILLCLFLIAICTSCVQSPYSAVETYEQSFYMIGNVEPYHALLEYVQNKDTGDAFAVLTVDYSKFDVDSRLILSWEDKLLEINGKKYKEEELVGKIFVSAMGQETIESLPKNFSSEMARERVQLLLQNLKKNEE